MKTGILLAFIIGFVQGYFGIVFIISFAGYLVNELTKYWGKVFLPITKLISSILAYIFLIIFFFGIAAIWIDLLSEGNELKKIEFIKNWGKGWFIGLLIFFLLPIVERAFVKKSNR